MSWFLNFFDFNGADIYTLLMKFAIHLLIAFLVIFIVSFLFMVFTNKTRNKQIGLSNWLRYALMWGVVVEIIAFAVIVILTLRANPFLYFYTINFSYSCGFVLMIPEMIVFIGLITVFYTLQNNIKKSIR